MTPEQLRFVIIQTSWIVGGGCHAGGTGGRETKPQAWPHAQTGKNLGGCEAGVARFCLSLASSRLRSH